MYTHTYKLLFHSGHILNKSELKVLSDLLSAYSNEKVKEIQRSLRKKRGRNILREEVERSLREGGMTTLATELEQSLQKGEWSQRTVCTMPSFLADHFRSRVVPHNIWE